MYGKNWLENDCSHVIIINGDNYAENNFSRW